MNRPRVIIADAARDTSFIEQLQIRFTEEYFYKIDLEIITLQALFEKQFSSPQVADVLIVSEQLFDESLFRHDIRNLFVVTEKENGDELPQGVNRIARYSSIKAVFSEIIGKSYPTFCFGEENKNQETQIVLVTSAAGGVGKTTLALGISASLAKSYKKVLYIDAEWIQSFAALLEDSSPIVGGEVYARLLEGNRDRIYEDVSRYIREEGFRYLPPFQAPLVSLNLSYRVFSQIAEGAKKSKQYDYIVLDSESSFDEEKARLINISDKVVVVTNQTKSAVRKTNRLCDNLSGTESEKYLYICNAFDEKEENYLAGDPLGVHFSVNDYVQRFSAMDKKTIESLVREKDVQRVAYLLI